jgi:hypothetical protein
MACPIENPVPKCAPRLQQHDTRGEPKACIVDVRCSPAGLPAALRRTRSTTKGPNEVSFSVTEADVDPSSHRDPLRKVRRVSLDEVEQGYRQRVPERHRGMSPTGTRSTRTGARPSCGRTRPSHPLNSGDATLGFRHRRLRCSRGRTRLKMIMGKHAQRQPSTRMLRWHPRLESAQALRAAKKACHVPRQHVYAAGSEVKRAIPRFLPSAFRDRTARGAWWARTCVRFSLRCGLAGHQLLGIARAPV